MSYKGADQNLIREAEEVFFALEQAHTQTQAEELIIAFAEKWGTRKFNEGYDKGIEQWMGSRSSGRFTGVHHHGPEDGKFHPTGPECLICLHKENAALQARVKELEATLSASKHDESSWCKYHGRPLFECNNGFGTGCPPSEPSGNKACAGCGDTDAPNIEHIGEIRIHLCGDCLSYSRRSVPSGLSEDVVRAMDSECCASFVNGCPEHQIMSRPCPRTVLANFVRRLIVEKKS